MIVYQSPGVYVQEVPAGPQPIAGAPTSVLAVIGATRRGEVNRPTRVTSWAGFLNLFGGSAPGGNTAEGVYGYFENGGEAVWVVRVDPSQLATWRVFEENGATESFRIQARSPGAWANALGVAVAPDFSAGAGQLYAARLVAPANVNTGAAVVTVSSVAGLAPGDAIRLVTQAGTRDATVDAINADTNQLNVTVAAGGAFATPADGTWVTAVVGGAATTVRLATGSGIHRGDVVVVTPAGRANIRTAFVEQAEPAQPGLGLTLAAGLGGDVVGVEFAARVERFTGDLPPGPGSPNMPMGTVMWRDSPGPRAADVAANFTATASNGMVGTWSTGNTRFQFPANVPAGQVQAEARVVAYRFTETVELVAPTLATLRERFSFVPNGTVLRLVRAGSDLDVTRNTAVAAGWDPPGSDPALQTWTSVEFRPSNDTTRGLLVRCAFEPRVDDWIDVGAAGRHRIAAVERVGTGVYVVRTATVANATAEMGPYPLLAFQQTQVLPQRFGIVVREGGVDQETYRGLALHPDHPSYYLRDEAVNATSARIRVTPRASNAYARANLPSLAVPLNPGQDRPATPADLKRGFGDLERVAEPAIVICPDTAGLDPLAQADVIGSMVTHCEEFRRFAIVDPPRGAADQDLADWRQRTVSSVQAAVYAPYVTITNLDPASPRRTVDVPPSGFVAGVYARTDRDRGVHKAPANERVRGIVGLAKEYTQREQDLLNPAAVNLIRVLYGRGMRIWGARNATDDVQWRYVNVRRLFNFVETSVERSTQWVVFEPNTASTWLRIRVSVENFLEQLWRSGALAGVSPEEAYRVRVGLGETMTEADIDLGLVITEVAIAPAKPAEFVVFRFSHKRISE